MKAIGPAKARILEIVSRTSNRRVRPVLLERALRREFGFTVKEFKRALYDLVKAHRLVYTYRDPCSFLEIPAAAHQSM